MARKIINIKDISHEEWLELRRKSIGGTDAAAACGTSPWKSPLELYAEKKGLIQDKETNESMRRGLYLEEYVAQRFEEETGKKVRKDNFMYADNELPYLTCNIDRVVVGENSALECKTTSDFVKYDIENGVIPIQYYYQLQHYMMVMGYEYMYIAFSTTFKFVWHRVERNQGFIDSMREAEKCFWLNCVVADVKPDVDASESSLETVRELYPEEVPDTELYLPIDDLGKEYFTWQMAKKNAEEQMSLIKAKICEQLGEFERGSSDDYRVSWKTQDKATLDSKKLQADHPDIYNQYVKTSSSRVFRINEIKK